MAELTSTNIYGNLRVADDLTIEDITLSSSPDRPGLLQYEGGPSWNGIQTLLGTQRWSFMGGETQAGIYDDTGNKWGILAEKDAGVSLYYNNGVKLATTNTGVNVTGVLTASGSISGSNLSGTNTGDNPGVTSVTAGNGLSGGGSSSSVSLALDFSELTTSAGTLAGTDYLIAENDGVEARQLISSIPLSIFDNDAGWTSNTGDITSIESYQTIQDGSILQNTSAISDVSTRVSVNESDITSIESYNIIQDNSIIELQNQTVQTWNGLSTSLDNSVGLGGTLDDDTDIDTSGFDFSITGGLSIYGTLSVDGSVTYINSVDLNVSDNIITVNYGETGAGVTKGFAGMKVDRGSEDDYVFVFSESTDTFRIGIATESGLPTGTQAVATREDTPIADAIAFWNDTANRFDTIDGFEFNSVTGLNVNYTLTANLLTLENIVNLSTENTGLVINTSGEVGYRELGSNAFSSEDYALDSSLSIVRDLVYIQDGSIGQNTSDISDVSTRVSVNESDITSIESDITSIESYQTIQDGSIGQNTSDISSIESDITSIESYQTIQDGSIGQNTSDISDVSTRVSVNESDITSIESYQTIQDGSILQNAEDIDILDASLIALTYWTLDGSVLVPIDNTVDVQLSSIRIDDNAGAVALVDMTVTDVPAVGTEESYAFNIDASAVMKVYGKADGAGALSETALVVEATYQYMGDPDTNGSWRFYVSNSGDLVFEKRISGIWTEKGKFTE
jgi:hypothetical protein